LRGGRRTLRAAILACCAAAGLAGCAAATSGSQSPVLQSPWLDRYAAGSALELLIHGLYQNYQQGIVTRGTPSHKVAVTMTKTSLGTPEAKVSDCSDCSDDSGAVAYSKSGKPVQGGGAGAAGDQRPGAAVRRHLEGDLPGSGEDRVVLTPRPRLRAGGRVGGRAAAGRRQQAALAGGGPGGVNPYGNVTCGQSAAPQCAVTAGSGASAGTPVSTSTQAGGQPAAGTAAAGGGGAAGGCQGTVNKTFGCVPAGCQVTVQTLACPIGADATSASGFRPRPAALPWDLGQPKNLGSSMPTAEFCSGVPRV
jgi:hypothetical protein